ncbi:MAG: T9SS C-terminal target domain-containing protein, partial [Sphingobacteriales bacterium]
RKIIPMIKKITLALFLIIFSICKSFSQTTLAAGDVAIIEASSTNPDQFSFVLLKDVAINTVINFTDNGMASTTTGNTGEGFLTWTAPSAQCAGTYFTWTNGMTISGTGFSSNNPSNFNFSTSGDQIFAFQGPTANWATQSGITLLFAVDYGNSGGWITSGGATSNKSYAPAALTPGASSMALNSGSPDCYFANGTVSITTYTATNTKSGFLTLIFAANKWYKTTYVSGAFLPTYSFTVTADEPTTQATNITFSSITNSSFTASWTNGNGASRAVFVIQSNAGSAAPFDATTYTANTTYTSGTQIGATGWYCVYKGTGTSVNITGLTTNTTYRVMVCEYNGSATCTRENYFTNTATNNPLNQNTDGNISGLTFTNVCLTTADVTWTMPGAYNSSTNTVLVFAKQTSAITAGTPSNNMSTYTASTTFGSGTAYQNDASAFCVYKGDGSSVSITNLTAGTSYYFLIYNVLDPNTYTSSTTTNGSTLTTPNNVTAQATTSGNGQLVLNWTNPTACYDEILVVGGTAAITSSPTGDGTAYSPSAVFMGGTSGNNLAASEYDLYQSTGNSVTVTGLTNGTLYSFKIFTRKGTVWSSGVTTSGTPSASFAGDFQSLTSGNWNDFNTWQIFSGGTWINAVSGQWPNSATSSVTVRAGHTVTVNGSGPYMAKDLTVASSGKLFCNTTTVNKYLDIYGNITCNGTIGNSPSYDDISFDIDAASCTITGTGTFACTRIRKDNNTNLTTNLIIDMNVQTLWNTSSSTQLYNNFNGTSTFNVTINAGKTFTCTNSGNVSLDGVDGTGANNRKGTITVNGTLTIPGIFYLTTNNASSNPCALSIGTTGVVNTATINASASGAGTHTLTISSGGKLNITGTGAFTAFSNTNNVYTLNAGSTVEYSAAGNQTIETGVGNYSNLICSGSGNKTPNATLTVSKDLSISGSAKLVPPSSNQINIGGNWTDYGTLGFTEGSASTVTFNGATTQTITCPSGEDFYNVTITNANATGVTLADNITIANDLDLSTTGHFTFGSTLHTVTLSKTAAASNTFKGSGTATLDISGAAHNFYIGCENASFSGTLNGGTTSTVYYNRNTGTGDQDIVAGTNITYANLTLNGSSGSSRNKKLSSYVTVNTSVTVDAVNLTVPNTSTTMTLGGALILVNSGTMLDNCRDDLDIITAGNSTQTFNGNTKTIKCFNLKSTKTAGGISLIGGVGTTDVNIKNDFALSYTSSSVFTDNGNLIKVGDDAEFGAATSTAANFSFTGTLKFICDGSAVATDAHLSDFAGTGASKAHINNLIIDPEAASLVSALDIYPTSGTQTNFIDGNIDILNTNSLTTHFNPHNNILQVKGYWNTYANSGFQATGSKVIFAGTSLQPITSTNYEVFNDIEINNSNNITLNAQIKINGTLTLTNGLINTGVNEVYQQNATVTSVSSYSAASYINGNLRRNVNASGSYDFPVGNATNYELATVNLNSQTGMTSILAFFNTTITGTAPSYPTTSINGDGINGILNSGFWTITPNAYTAVNYDVTLNQRGYSNFSGNANQLGVIKRPNSGSTWAGTNLSGANGFHNNATQFISAGTAIAKRTSVTAFSDFAIGYGANPLPIQLTTFTAENVNDVSVLLKWETESEINNNYFCVERSVDGKTFSEIGIVNGNGTTETKHNYTLSDEAPISGVSYYRLKQVDFDGNFSYSQIIAVEIHSTQTDWSIYPNPVSEQLTVNCNQFAGSTINLMDVFGRIIISQKINLKSEIINLKSIPSGIYFIELNDGRASEVKKFVKR